jgi:hypothetical protein
MARFGPVWLRVLGQGKPDGEGLLRRSKSIQCLPRGFFVGCSHRLFKLARGGGPSSLGRCRRGCGRRDVFDDRWANEERIRHERLAGIGRYQPFKQRTLLLGMVWYGARRLADATSGESTAAEARQGLMVINSRRTSESFEAVSCFHYLGIRKCVARGSQWWLGRC